MRSSSDHVKDREDAFRRTSEGCGSALRCAPLCFHESGSDSWHWTTREGQPGPATGRGKGRRRPADTTLPNDAAAAIAVSRLWPSPSVGTRHDFWRLNALAEVQPCLAAGEDVNVRGEWGTTPRHFAASLQLAATPAATVKLPLTEGAKVRVRNDRRSIGG